MQQQYCRVINLGMKRFAGSLIAAALLASCGERTAPSAVDVCSADAVRADVVAVLAEVTRATRAKDIDAYMRLVPEESVIDDTSGELVDRDQLRANVLRDWAIIPETLRLEHVVGDVTMNGCDEAVVMVDQTWERTMLRPDNEPGTDRILTTQRHREIWRRTANGWRGFEIEELGGEIFVNGVRYGAN